MKSGNMEVDQRDESDLVFASRMVSAGLTPATHIGIAVSGGPDSTALCILASRWIQQEGGSLCNLMGFIVDHGLRVESASEALTVQSRIAALGIRCEVLKCFWPDGVPAQGHIQEVARTARYELIHKACKRNGMDVLLTAHHLDDQIELFIIRLTRHSGLAGLAGMPFVSQLYQFAPDYAGKDVIHTILLVRPLLGLSKNDLYEVCKKHTQPWVEDPTNSKLVFLRNVVRSFLNKPDFYILKKDVPRLIMLCRTMRTLFDKGRDVLLLEAVSIDQNFGYAVVDLKELKITKERKQSLKRTLVALLQFVAQKEKPPRGKVLQTLVDHIISGHLKGALTLAGCNVCVDPGSKGTRLLICVSCDSKVPASTQPMNTVWAYDPSNSGKPCSLPQGRIKTSELAFCLSESTLESHPYTRFTKVENALQFLSEAKQAGILSDRSVVALSKLLDKISLKSTSTEGKRLQKETEKQPDVGCSKSIKLQIPCDHACYFMNRFLIAWGKKPEHTVKTDGKPSTLQTVQGCRFFSAESSFMQSRKALWVRYMKESDWIFLSQCAEQNHCFTDLRGLHDHEESRSFAVCNTDVTGLNSEEFAKKGSQQRVYIKPCCLDCLAKRAQGALAKLKSIPLPVRIGLPVFVTAQGALFSIPSLGFSLCPNIWVISRFCPKVPLGGGHASWL